MLRLPDPDKSNPEIGQALYIIATTMRLHVTAIPTRLNVANRTQAAGGPQEWHLVRVRVYFMP